MIHLSINKLDLTCNFIVKVKYEAITFDLWFTLIWLDKRIYEEYTAGRVRAIYDVISRYYRGISWETILTTYNKTSNLRMILHPSDVISYILRELNIVLNDDQFNEIVNKYVYASENVLPYLNAEAPYVLDKLWKMGVKLGIITNTSFTSDSLRKILGKLGIAKYFNIIISSCDVGVTKPNPEIFNLALKHLNVDKEKVIHVGDNYDDDIIGAKKVNIKPILYRGLWSKYRNYPRAIWRCYDKDKSILIIDNLTQLLSVVFQ